MLRLRNNLVSKKAKDLVVLLQIKTEIYLYDGRIGLLVRARPPPRSRSCCQAIMSRRKTARPQGA